MILIKGVLINENTLNSVYEEDGRTRVHFVEANSNFNTNKFTAKEIYNAIEAKESFRLRQEEQAKEQLHEMADRIKAMRQELYDESKVHHNKLREKETICVQLKNENEKLRLQIEKLTINLANATECEFALVGKDGLCIGNEDCPTDCCKCEIYADFCLPAKSDDETGCEGLKDGTGKFYRKCQICAGWIKTPAEDPKPEEE